MINDCWGISSGYDQWSSYKFNIDSLKPLYFWGARDKTSWGQDRNSFMETNTWEIFGQIFINFFLLDIFVRYICPNTLANTKTNTQTNSRTDTNSTNTNSTNTTSTNTTSTNTNSTNTNSTNTNSTNTQTNTQRNTLWGHSKYTYRDYLDG